MDQTVVIVTTTTGERLALFCQGLGDLGFELSITNGSNVWKGDGALTFEKRPASRSNETKETYIENLGAALQPSFDTQQGLSQYKFTYDFSIDSGGSATFTVKQQMVGASHFLVLYKGVMVASARPAESMLGLFSVVIEMLLAKEQEMSYLRDDGAFYRETVDKLTEDTQQFGEWKETLQDRLIKSFCAVLNSKKREIVRLEAETGGGSRGRGKSSTKLSTIAEADYEQSGEDDGSVASSTKPTGRGRKAPAAKKAPAKKPAARGRGKKAIQEEEEEEEDDDGEEHEDDESAAQEEEPAPKSRATRGRAVKSRPASTSIASLQGKMSKSKSRSVPRIADDESVQSMDVDQQSDDEEFGAMIANKPATAPTTTSGAKHSAGSFAAAAEDDGFGSSDDRDLMGGDDPEDSNDFFGTSSKASASAASSSHGWFGTTVATSELPAQKPVVNKKRTAAAAALDDDTDDEGGSSAPAVVSQASNATSSAASTSASTAAAAKQKTKSNRFLDSGSDTD